MINPALDVDLAGDESNYNLSEFDVNEFDIETHRRTHRIPMGVFSTAGTYWLLLKHDPNLFSVISRDVNEDVPNANRIPANGFYITIQPVGAALNHKRRRLERVRVDVWGHNKNKVNLGSEIVIAALRRYLRKGKKSAVERHSTGNLYVVSVTGQYQTFISEHEET